MHDIAQLAAAIAAGAVALACAAGCGAARSAAGHDQFAAKADAICTEEHAKLAYIAARARRLGRSSQSPPVIRQQATQSQLATGRLQAVAPPSREAGAITRWLTARTVAATVALDLAEAPRHGEAAAVADVRAQAARALAQASAQAATLGLGKCSEVG